MDDSIDGLHGKPNSTRIIVYENKYDEDGLLIGMTARSEIIMCKDCKHCEHWYADKGRCFLWHEDGIGVFEDGYCNYAERRTDEYILLLD